MKLTIILLLLSFAMTSSWTCCKPVEKDLMLDKSRSWLPLKGRTQLFFIDESGQPVTFSLRVIDTIENRSTRCSEYKAEYIDATLYLNPTRSDSIYFHLEPPNFLLLKAYSGNLPTVDVGDVLNYKRQGLIEKFTNYNLGNRTYNEVILTLPYPSNLRIIDSVYIANNYGIVGFKYLDKKYTLQ
jgi:hypothetical protein